MCITTITLPVCGHHQTNRTISNDLFPIHHSTGPGTHVSQCEASRCHRVCRGDTRTVHSAELCSACDRTLNVHLNGARGGDAAAAAAGKKHGFWSGGGNNGRPSQGSSIGSWHLGPPPTPQQERLQMVNYPQPGPSEYEPLMFGRSNHNNSANHNFGFTFGAMPPNNAISPAPMAQQPSGRTGGGGGLFSTYQPFQLPSMQPQPPFQQPQMTRQPQVQQQQFQQLQFQQEHHSPFSQLPHHQQQQQSSSFDFHFTFDSDLEMDLGPGFTNPFSTGSSGQFNYFAKPW